MNPVIKELAIESGLAAYVVRKWKLRGHVPHAHRLPMLREAEKRGLPLTDADFDFGVRQIAKPRRRRKAA